MLPSICSSAPNTPRRLAIGQEVASVISKAHRLSQVLLLYTKIEYIGQSNNTMLRRGQYVQGNSYQPCAARRPTSRQRYSCTQVARTGALSTLLKGEDPPGIWALSPLGCPGATLEEMLADIQTSRPTATSTLVIGPTVGDNISRDRYRYDAYLQQYGCLTLTFVFDVSAVSALLLLCPWFTE